MTRYLKVLGLALVAMLALAATMASAASAKGVLTSDGPVTLDGTDIEGGGALSAFGIPVECAHADYHIGQPTTFAETIETEEPHDPEFSDGDTAFTVVPTSQNPCVAAGFLPMTIDMTGCDFDLELSEETETAGTWDVTSILTCPTSHAPEITIYLSESAHTADEPFCHVTIESTEIGKHLSGATASNNSGTVLLGGTVEGIGMERSGPCASENPEANTDAEVTLSLSAEVSGTNEEAEPTEIEISEE